MKDLAHINEICAQFDCDPANLIAIMQEIQAADKYLSEQALTRVAENLHIGTAKVYSVATFYENFSLEPKGKHVIKVCAGTACHVRSTTIWALRGGRRPRQTAFLPWRQWPVWGRAAWRR